MVSFLMFAPYFLFRSTEELLKFLSVINNKEEAIGEIIKYKKERGGYKEPVISFLTKKGEKIISKSPFYTSTSFSVFKSYESHIGKKVDIFYNRNEPTNFVVRKNLNYLYLAFTLFFIIGFLFLGIGIAALFGKVQSMKW